ncbi:hypothetical protein ACROYT_G025380 [Oculina patagonica]
MKHLLAMHCGLWRCWATQDNASEERDDQEKEPTSEDWREKILVNANPKSVQEETITSTEEIISSTAETGSSDKPAAVTRPRRNRRRQDYLKDYVTLKSGNTECRDIFF